MLFRSIKDVNQQIKEDKSGFVWIVNGDGELHYFNNDTEELTCFNVLSSSSIDFESAVRRTFIDRQNNIWAFHYRDFSIITPRDILSESYFSGENMRVVYRDKNNNVWFSSKDGHLIRKSEDGIIKYMNPEGKLISEKCLFGYNVYSFLHDRDNNLWLGTKDDGLCMMTSQGDNYILKWYRNDPTDKYSLNDNNIYSIFENTDGSIWIGTFGGGIKDRKSVV